MPIKSTKKSTSRKSTSGPGRKAKMVGPATRKIGKVKTSPSPLYENVFKAEGWKIIEQRHTKFVKNEGAKGRHVGPRADYSGYSGEFVNSVYLIKKGRKACVVRVYRAPGSGQTKVYDATVIPANSDNISGVLKGIVSNLEEAEARYVKVPS